MFPEANLMLFVQQEYFKTNSYPDDAADTSAGLLLHGCVSLHWLL